MITMRTACYPGSFDPVTSGHLDIIERASQIFDKLLVAVGINYEKKPLFTVEERKEMLRETTSHLKNVKVESFDGLLVDFLKNKNCKVIVKGLRAVSDFEIEFQMALINKKLGAVETTFLVTSADNLFLSSSIVKEIASFGGEVKELVPPNVEKKLKEKLKTN